MQVSNLANHPIELPLGERTFKIKRLSLLDLYGEFENEVKEEYINDIVKIASKMKSSSERITFQREAMKDIPKGKELEDSCQAKMDSMLGGIKMLYMALDDDNDITFEELKTMLGNNRENPEFDAQVGAIVNYIIGVDSTNEKDNDKNDKNAKIDLEKKTT